MDTPSYSPAGELQALTHNLGGSAQDVTFSCPYTAAHQLRGVSSANPACHCSGSHRYTRNALNQFTQIDGPSASQSLSYDLKGTAMNPNPDQKARQTQAASHGEDVPAHKKQRARRIFFSYLGAVAALWWVRVAAGNEPDALVLISFYLAWNVWQGYSTGSMEFIDGKTDRSIYPSAHKFWSVVLSILSLLTAAISLS